jgi:hypothetical protein
MVDLVTITKTFCDTLLPQSLHQPTYMDMKTQINIRFFHDLVELISTDLYLIQFTSF